MKSVCTRSNYEESSPLALGVATDPCEVPWGCVFPDELPEARVRVVESGYAAAVAAFNAADEDSSASMSPMLGESKVSNEAAVRASE